MMFGGDVKGGRVLGEYPDDLTDNGPFTLPRGRMIPTTPWDSCFQSIAMWMGVHGSDLDKVCPNRMNFPSSKLFVGEDLFNSTISPTSYTLVPTSSPNTRSS